MNGLGFSPSIGRQTERASGPAQSYGVKSEHWLASICKETSNRLWKAKNLMSDGRFLHGMESISPCGNPPARQTHGCWKDFRKEMRQPRFAAGNVSVRVMPCPSVT